MQEVAETWARLGRDDPMWAVLTDRGGWEPEEFLATGAEEIAVLLRRLEELGARPPLERALDFGCGAGRLTHGLLRAGAVHVLALDVSEPMLETARSLVADPSAEFVTVTGPELPGIPDGSVDLVYSCRVLQHMPPELAASYICEFYRVARSGGVVVFQVPVRPAAGIAGLVLRVLPAAVATRLRRGMEMHGTSTKRVREIVARAGGQILAEDQDGSAGPRWESRLYLTRVAQTASPR